MIFKFKNIGIIEEANIELNGITVLTGLNDTGKSFLGKSIYSIIQTLTEAESFLSFEKYSQATNLLNSITAIHRQFVPFTQEKVQQFNVAPISNKIAQAIISQTVPTDLVVNDILDYTLRVRNDLELYKPDRPSRIIDEADAKIQSHSRSLITLLLENLSNEKKYKSYFDRIVVQKIFQSQLNSVLNESELEINIEQGVTNLLNIVVDKNSTKTFAVNNELFLNNATLIDTPTIIHLTDFITNSLAFTPGGRQRADLPQYYIDLAEKLRISPPNQPSFFEISNKIKNIISGEFTIKSEDNGIVFMKNGNAIRPFNIATGVKSFGLLQLLLNSVFIGPSSLLIIDEPEVHLHPKWEVEYAKILIEISKLGVCILISSHSPYFLRALRKYSKEDEATNLVTKFYFGEKKQNSNRTHFIDVTDNPEPIFKALAEPMMSLS